MSRDLSCCTVSFRGSVKGPQGVALLHKNLCVDSEFGAVCSSLSTLHVAVPVWLHRCC